MEVLDGEGGTLEVSLERVPEPQGPRFLFDSVPDEVWHELEYEIARAGLEHADNYRAYRPLDGFLVGAFKKARKHGCCGSFETAIKTRDGVTWTVGCNHGH